MDKDLESRIFLFYFFFGHALGMLKFPGQGSNPLSHDGNSHVVYFYLQVRGRQEMMMFELHLEG